MNGRGRRAPSGEQASFNSTQILSAGLKRTAKDIKLAADKLIYAFLSATEKQEEDGAFF